MTERELLDLAAKAAGIEITWEHGQDFPERVELFRGHLANYEPWNPLTDDGDALRLVVTLGIEVSYHHDKCQSLAVVPGTSRGRGEYWHSGEPMEATRRAIVHAAAAIHLAKEPPCSSTS
ncbi:hypothetical protein [Comamonas odontotermitis]|uniref:hypothetical protein n=1 Tax=Comamonas odontotermitis TaxID=379895 RepID=UPI001CC5A15C|nr:hypothetical protein [Comamonas odontotermitis]UBB15467.1 hypothetical protein LAD35_11330 [Comamonas odontotermitis]